MITRANAARNHGHQGRTRSHAVGWMGGQPAPIGQGTPLRGRRDLRLRRRSQIAVGSMISSITPRRTLTITEPETGSILTREVPTP
jgi:hypothetical protein